MNIDWKHLITTLLCAGIAAVTLGWSQIKTNTHDIARHEKQLERLTDMSHDLKFIRDAFERAE